MAQSIAELFRSRLEGDHRTDQILATLTDLCVEASRPATSRWTAAKPPLNDNDVVDGYTLAQAKAGQKALNVIRAFGSIVGVAQDAIDAFVVRPRASRVTEKATLLARIEELERKLSAK